MKSINKILIGVVGVFLVLALWFGSTYNNFVRLNEQVNTNWAQVETQYQRRYDLIPNLVEATKGVLTQEQEVFSTIAMARQGYAGAKTPDEKATAVNQLETSLSRLLVIVENYPNLKSNETVQSLMDELAGTENRVSVERSRYNEVVQQYNVTIKTLPNSLIAGMFGFKSRTLFEAVEQAASAPKVDLKLNK